MRLTLPLQALLGLAAFTGLSFSASAQLSWGGTPPSVYDAALADGAPTVTMPTVDVWRLEAEDAAATKVGAMRFGEELPVHLTPGNSGEWTQLENGDRVWRLRIESKGAFSLSLIFDEYELPAGAELYAYNDDRSSTYGLFSSLNNKENRQFAFQPLKGSALTLEYVEPAGVSAPGALSVGTVVHDYKNVFQLVDDMLAKSTGGPKAAGSCNNDVNCPEGAPWGDQIRAVAAIFIGGGVTFAAKPRDHSEKVNRKMYRAAMAAILSELNRLGRLLVVESFELETPRTRDLVAKLAQLGVTTPLIVTESGTEALYLAARNLPYVEVRDVQGMDPVSLVGAEYVVITAEAVKKVEEWLA